MSDKEWDVFISHASEDKDDFVRPLAQTLAQLGVKVWFDEFTLDVGDSLSRSIDEGLACSCYGIVVISPSFIQKKWPERELRGLVQREVLEDVRLILPIWFGVTQQEVVDFSPTLSDAYALRASYMDAEQIALALLKTVRPDIYSKHPRSELQKLLTGEALQDLQEELECVREELAQFQCPDCGAPLSARSEVELDAEFGVSGELERFECGYAHVDGSLEQPCPSDPLFPKFEDYELVTQETNGQWTCYARPKTKMAQHVLILKGAARTEEETKDQVRRRYERAAEKWRP